MQRLAENQLITSDIIKLRAILTNQPRHTDAHWSLAWSLIQLAIFFPIAIHLYKKRTSE